MNKPLSKNYVLAVATLFAHHRRRIFRRAVCYCSRRRDYVFCLSADFGRDSTYCICFLRAWFYQPNLRIACRYVGIYAAENIKRGSFFSLVSGYGTLLAYVILGGQFFARFARAAFRWQFNFLLFNKFSVEALIVLAGIKLIAGTSSC